MVLTETKITNLTGMSLRLLLSGKLLKDKKVLFILMRRLMASEDLMVTAEKKMARKRTGTGRRLEPPAFRTALKLA